MSHLTRSKPPLPKFARFGTNVYFVDDNLKIVAGVVVDVGVLSVEVMLQNGLKFKVPFENVAMTESIAYEKQANYCDKIVKDFQQRRDKCRQLADKYL